MDIVWVKLYYFCFERGEIEFRENFFDFVIIFYVI